MTNHWRNCVAVLPINEDGWSAEAEGWCRELEKRYGLPPNGALTGQRKEAP